MNKRLDSSEPGGLLTQIMLNPLSYIHPRRLRLSNKLNTPRQRAIVNRMLIAGVPEASDCLFASHYVSRLRLLHCWRLLPFVCTLVGAHLLKQELAWQGRMLKLSAAVRFFMFLPLQHSVGANGSVLMDLMPHGGARAEILSDKEYLLLQVQAVGLSCLLDWQQHASEGLLGRMRLLFPPELEACFFNLRRPVQSAELMLILQAIEYDKNHPNGL